MKHKLTTCAATLLLCATAYSTVSAPVAYANTDIQVKDIIKQITENTNQLPVDKIEGSGDTIHDLTVVLQKRRKAIAKKISEINGTSNAPVVDEVPAEEPKSETKQSEEQTPAEKPEQVEQPKPQEPIAQTPPPQAEGIQYQANGLLVEAASPLAQSVVNGLLGIPGHANGAYYHQNGLDNLINQLSTAEAVWVVHRIEGAGFGQTGDGFAGIDTPASHRTFVQNQVNRRFGGSVHALLRAWGTFSYGGY